MSATRVAARSKIICGERVIATRVTATMAHTIVAGVRRRKRRMTAPSANARKLNVERFA